MPAIPPGESSHGILSGTTQPISRWSDTVVGYVPRRPRSGPDESRLDRLWDNTTSSPSVRPWIRPSHDPDGDTVRRAAVGRSGDDRDRGDGFLYKMCRGIAGTLVQVGLGRFSRSPWFPMLESRDRRLAGMSAPAQGLVLWKVAYRKRPGDSVADPRKLKSPRDWSRPGCGCRDECRPSRTGDPTQHGEHRRLCAATRATLHLIELLGFDLGDRERAGMDYWQQVTWRRWPNWAGFRESVPSESRIWFIEQGRPDATWM